MSLQAHVTPDVAERVAAGGAVACVQHLASEPLAIWSSHAVLVQACNQVSTMSWRCKNFDWPLALSMPNQRLSRHNPLTMKGLRARAIQFNHGLIHVTPFLNKTGIHTAGVPGARRRHCGRVAAGRRERGAPHPRRGATAGGGGPEPRRNPRRRRRRGVRVAGEARRRAAARPRRQRLRACPGEDCYVLTRIWIAGEGLHEGDVRLLARAGSAYVPVQVMTFRV